MSDNKRIAKNTLYLYFRMLLVMGVTLYTSRVVLQALGFEDFGLYNVVGGIVMMFSFLNGALSSATSRFITFELGRKDYNKLNKIFNVAFVIHIALALIVIILAETIGLWLFFEKMTIPHNRLNAAFWVYQISILTCFFTFTQVPYTASIIAHENMKIFAYVGIADALGRLIIAYLIRYSFFDKLVFYAFLLFFLQVIIMMFYRFYSKRYAECKLKLCKEKNLYVKMFSYAGSDMIGSLSVLAQGQGLNILLNIFFGPAVNAARGIAYQVQGAITHFSSNFFTAVRPQIIKLYAVGKIDEMMVLVRNSSWFSFYLILMISLPIYFEVDFILGIWLGEYPDYTPLFLRLIIILCLIQTLKTPRSTVFHATGKLFLVNVVVGGILCFAFPLAYIFLKLGGTPESVFWAANLTMIISEFISVFILRKYINYSIKNYLLKIHLRCFLVTVITASCLFQISYLLESGYLRLFLTCISSVTVVSIVAYIIGIDYSMRRKVIKIVKNKIIR